MRLKHLNSARASIAGGIFATLLVGCGGESRKPLYYQDGAYSAAVYEYLNEEGDVRAQIASLEKVLQKAYEKNAAVPPGLYAHLGLLYSNIGDDAQARAYFDKEAATFPESRAYIELLLSRNKAKK